MSVHLFAPQSLNVEPAAPRRITGSFLCYVVVECLTWLFLIGMVGTVSAGGFGSGAYTLAVAAAGIAVSFIRRSGAARLTLFTAVIELITLFLIVGVASNPSRNGLTTVVVALAAWVAIEVVRARFWQPTTVIAALGQVAILIGAGVVMDGRTPGVPSLAPMLAVWIAAEFGWRWLSRALILRHRFDYRLTRRQGSRVALVIFALLLALMINLVVNFTTAQYDGKRVSMAALQGQRPVPYCITYVWKIGGLNLSALGLGGPTECFDTEAELRQAASNHEWVSRRTFSDEHP